MTARRIVMLLENNPYPQDVRVRGEAEALVAAGHEVTVLAPRDDGQPPRENVGGVNVRRFRLPPDRETVASLLAEYAVAHVQLIGRALAALVRGADVVHLHNPPDTLFPAAAVARLLGRRVVFDSHDLSPELFAEKFGTSPVVAVMRLAQRLSFRLADVVLATNESQADVARAARRSRDGIVVVRNGPRRAHFATNGAQRDGELADPRLLFLGTVASQDGVLRLPELVRALREDHGLAGTRLTVVGDGPARPELERALREAGVADAVDFTGWVPYDTVPGLLAAADICVDPAPCGALNHKSTMMKVAEYLAAGRPVVAYALVETERTLGGAGLVAPCGDERAFAERVAKIARDAPLRRRLAQSALDRRDALAWERSAEALVAAYAAL